MSSISRFGTHNSQPIYSTNDASSSAQPLPRSDSTSSAGLGDFHNRFFPTDNSSGASLILASNSIPPSGGPSPALQQLPQGLPDLAYDGALVGAGERAYYYKAAVSQIPTVTPQPGQAAATGRTVIFVDGADTNLARSSRNLQRFANTTCIKPGKTLKKCAPTVPVQD